MPKYKLSYFDFAGRAELIRLIFSAGKVDFEDHRFSFDEWKKLKAETPFGTVPILYIDGTPLGESGAIIRYVATECKLNGANSLQAAYIEMIHGVLSDSYSKLPFFEKDLKLKKQKTNEVHNESILPNLLKMEKKYIERRKEYLIGDSLSYADLKLMNNLIMTENIAPEFLVKIPKLNALKNKLKNLDGIKEYLAKRPKSSYYK